ncbi:hypothetical protein HYDPIDRAFT_119507 [Hydnomerulius pinastri MD-312]|uniref:Uncharacterized protein n=1 Tax=Hydnomerulius pinastri MD-312 TaxID=994086 RepID=A0A0C9W6P4_9AGAM|nr:hypothetical protein HYDPIDRAFT_119507 [Hydnomerulius pinastri MD-312]
MLGAPVPAPPPLPPLLSLQLDRQDNGETQGPAASSHRHNTTSHPAQHIRPIIIH